MAVNEIVEQLRREETNLIDQLSKIQQQEKKSTGQLKQVQSALTALGEKPVGKPGGKSGKKSVTKSDVIAAMEIVLRRSNGLQVEALKNATETNLREQGRSLAGFALRFKEALVDGRFSDASGSYRLANQNSTEQPAA